MNADWYVVIGQCILNVVVLGWQVQYNRKHRNLESIMFSSSVALGSIAALLLLSLGLQKVV